MTCFPRPYNYSKRIINASDVVQCTKRVIWLPEVGANENNNNKNKPTKTSNLVVYKVHDFVTTGQVCVCLQVRVA